jgi:hypothetical protein
MRMKIILSILGLFIFLGCSKDDFETKPKITIKSVNSEFVPFNGTLSIRMEFRDKEGDVEDSLIVVRERLNVRSTDAPTELKYDIPTFPAKSKGEFEVNIPFSTGLALNLNPIRIDSATNEFDTLRLKFVVKDKAENASDTAILDRIIVNRTP